MDNMDWKIAEHMRRMTISESFENESEDKCLVVHVLLSNTMAYEQPTTGQWHVINLISN